MSVSEKLVEQTGVIGEKLELSNYNVINADYVTAYIHPGNKLASVVGFNISSVNNIQDIGKNIAMQIAAMNPIGLDETDVTHSSVADAKAFFFSAAALTVIDECATQEAYELVDGNTLQTITSFGTKRIFPPNTGDWEWVFNGVRKELDNWLSSE